MAIFDECMDTYRRLCGDTRYEVSKTPGGATCIATRSGNVLMVFSDGPSGHKHFLLYPYRGRRAVAVYETPLRGKLIDGGKEAHVRKFLAALR